jgi:hypothetical protein
MSTRRDGDPARCSAARELSDSRRTGGRGGEGEDGKGTEAEADSVEGEVCVDEDGSAQGISAGVGGGVVSSREMTAGDGESPTDNPSELSASAGVPRRGGVTAGLLSLLPRRGNTIAGACEGEPDGELNDARDDEDARRGTVGIGPDAGVDHVDEEVEAGAAFRSIWWACCGERWWDR